MKVAAFRDKEHIPFVYRGLQNTQVTQARVFFQVWLKEIDMEVIGVHVPVVFGDLQTIVHGQGYGLFSDNGPPWAGAI